MPYKICIIGSGNWGSAIAKIIGNNVQAHSGVFDQHVTMYVYEEVVNGRKLTEIINTEHENVKYLPGIKLPSNVVAVPDVVEAAKDANILVFVVPHQFVINICKSLHGKIAHDAKAISLIKGIDTTNGIQLISDVIRDELNIEVGVLMGANIAGEVAAENFCETTVGCANVRMGGIYKQLFNTSYFRVNVVTDTIAVELCGALKNIVGVAAGLADGLKLGDNSKAAIIRIGLCEMMKFARLFYNCNDFMVYFESCGVADLITTCAGGRNRKVAEAYVQTRKPFQQLEAELLNGQKLQGTLTAKEVYHVLSEKKLTQEFPLFTAVYQVCFENLDPQLFLTSL
ncbi:glycerol-3-phosphate dehydrogenase, variant [Capsaspora owczarzaki ATCC 30864]|nr:glycerol-3-phosphate dehydrogenase, variant [Capsaspora owczarzaki ATCC 30864]|eukprot:XP_011270240.1 glycerol-3-phosphate dehydrogenase, variant [Capsaspora owczarzaki ATCC 30864]